MDYSYTDLEETGGLPLSQAWERAAIKDLSDVLHYLTHGLFFNPIDYAERLRQSADSIEFDPHLTPTIPPPPAAQTPPTHGSNLPGAEVAIALGVFLNALEIAACQLGVDTGVLIRYGQARIQNQADSDINALYERVLAAATAPAIPPPPPQVEDQEIMQIITHCLQCSPKNRPYK